MPSSNSNSKLEIQINPAIALALYSAVYIANQWLPYGPVPDYTNILQLQLDVGTAEYPLGNARNHRFTKHLGLYIYIYNIT